MQILISCAKTMAAASDIALPAATEAPFRAEAEQTALQLAALTTDELARLLRVIAAYTGVVFKHIDPAGFSPDDFAYAQQHLNITSFLYGLLRPLDAIRSYRLEGDAVLPGPDDRTVFARWPERLTDLLIDRVRADDGILVNLASAEMKRLFDWRRVRREVRVITPEFRVREGGRLRTIVVYTKMCRGEMTRSLIRGRISDPETLRGFEWEGFRYDAALGRGDDWTFVLQ